MFCLLTGAMGPDDLATALTSLAELNVCTKTYGEREARYMVVEDIPGDKVFDEAYMAELGFMLTFKQVGKICPHCAADPCADCEVQGQCASTAEECPNKRNLICGHITFGSHIDSAAFDKAVLRGTS